MKNKEVKFVDLFAGIGGMRMAFERSGGRCVFSSEWDKFAQITYRENFGELPEGDIRNVRAKDIPEFDLLVAGFPCQPFSISGVSKKNALGRPHGFLDETQGTLFFEIARIIKEKKPRAFLLENVKNLISHDKGRTFDIIRKTLTDELGYSIKFQVLNASSVLPQNRERVFIAGFISKQDSERFFFPTFEMKHQAGGLLKFSGPRLSEILEKKVDEKYYLSDKLWNYLQLYKEKHRAQGNGFGFGLADTGGITRTLSARYYKDGSEILIPVKGKNPRRLTPRECARLMGFPDDFKIPVSDTQAYRQFGNSVAVPLVAPIARVLIQSLSSGKTSETTPKKETGPGRKKAIA